MSDSSLHPPTPESQSEKAAIQLDLYGVKANVRPADPDAPPTSWREVGRRLNGILMRLAIAPFEFTTVVFEASVNLVRGIGNVPSSLGRLISRAHDRSDRREKQRQEQALTAPPKPLPPPNVPTPAEERLEEKLAMLQAQGYHVEIRNLGNGRAAIIIVRPGCEEIVGGDPEGAAGFGGGGGRVSGEMLPLFLGSCFRVRGSSYGMFANSTVGDFGECG